MNTNNKTRPQGTTNRIRRSAIAVAVATCLSAQVAYGNPTKPVVVNGAASFAQNGNLFTVTNSPNAIINWGSFSIGTNEITRFIQQSNASAVLNRVVGQNPSSILGALQSNGRVFLINPNGIVFGAGSQIDVGGLVASTLNLSNADFLAGRMRFTEGLGNSVLNQGNITTPPGGNVYLIGNAVTNNGLITSPKGDVILAAGNSVELVNPGTPNLRVEITAPDNEARNLGQIVADSGRVGIYAGLINHSGSINANSVEVDQAGQITLKATKNTTLEAGSTTTANGPAGGRIEIQSGDTTLVSGNLEASASQGKGGSINVLGNLVGLTGNATLNASGETGGGTVLIGGDYQGKSQNIQNAFRTYVGPDTSIKADAIANGDGGKVIVWADDVTRYYGSISAKGGANSGNGGTVEVSGKGYLDFNGQVDTTAPYGKTGTLLLDPTNIEVITGGAATTAQVDQFADPDLTTCASMGGAACSKIDPATIVTAAGTTDVVLQATNDILFTNFVSMSPSTTSRTFSATANRDITVNAGISLGDTSSLGGPNSRQINLTAGRNLTVASTATISATTGNATIGGSAQIDLIAGNTQPGSMNLQGDILATGNLGGNATINIELKNTGTLTVNRSIIATGGNGFTSPGGAATVNIAHNSGFLDVTLGPSGDITATSGDGTPVGSASVSLTGGTGISVNSGGGSPREITAIADLPSGKGNATVALTANTGGITVSNTLLGAGGHSTDSTQAKNALTGLTANGTGGFITLDNAQAFAFGVDTSTVSFGTSGLLKLDNGSQVFVGNDFSNISTPGATGLGKVMATANGISVLNGSTIQAYGQPGDFSSTPKGGDAQVTLNAGSGGITINGSGLINAVGGDGDGSSGGNGGNATTNLTGTSILIGGTATMQAAGGGSSGGTPGTATVNLNATAGNIDNTSTGPGAGDNAWIKASSDTGSGTALNLQASNAITNSAGAGYLRVQSLSGGAAQTGSQINLVAASGIGVTSAPIRIYDGSAAVSVTNGAGGGGIVLSQVTGDLSAAQLTVSNSSAGALDLQAEGAGSGGTILVPSTSVIDYLSGPVILRAAKTIAAGPLTSGPPDAVKAGGDITLIANDIQVRRPVIANNGTGTITVRTNGGPIDLGAVGDQDAPILGLDTTDFANFKSANLIIGDGTSLITNSVAVTVPNTYVTTINAGANAITLTQANDFTGALSLNNTGANNVAVTDVNALVLGGLNIGTGTLTVTAGGPITQTGAITQAAGAGAVNFNAGANAITLNNVNNNFTGAVSLNNSGANNVAVADVNALVLGTSNVGTGTLTVTASGPITQTGAVTQAAGAGAATFNAGANGITLTNTGNNFTGTATLTGSTVSVTDSNALTVVLNATNASTINAAGNLVVSGNTVGLNTTTTNLGTTSFGTTNVTGGFSNLSVTSAGAVTQTGPITMSGLFTSINAGTNAITLTNPGNDFNNAFVIPAGFTGSTVQVTDVNALAASINASGPATLSAGGNLAVAGSAAGLTTVMTGAGTTTLGFAPVNVNVAGNLTINSAGAVTQLTPVTVTGTSNINAGANAITLTNAGNNFVGAVSLNNTGANNVAVTDVNALALGTSNLGTGTLTVTAGGPITQTGGIVQAIGAGAASFNAGAGNITLNGANNFSTVNLTGGTVMVSQSGPSTMLLNTTGPTTIIRNADLTVSGNAAGLTIVAGAPPVSTLTFGTTTVNGNLDASSLGAITQTGALIVTGTAKFDPGFTNPVTLPLANDFQGMLTINCGCTVAVRDANALTAVLVAAPTTNGPTATFTANGNLVVSGDTSGLTTMTTGGGTTTFGTTNIFGGGSLSTTSTGAVTQTGALSVTGTSAINAGTNPITLANAGNNFTGAVSLTGTNINLFDANNVTIGALSVGGTNTVGAGASIIMQGPVTATSAATLTLSPGTQVQTPSGTTLTLDGGTVGLTTLVNNGKVWQNDGTINLAGNSTIRLPNVGGYATFSNTATGVLNINSSAGWSFLSDSTLQGGIVNNAGTINVNNSTSWEAAATNTSTGTLKIASGKFLSMQNGQSIAGAVDIGAGGTLWVSERHGVNAAFNNTAITGTGTLQVISSSGPIADLNNVNAPAATLLVGNGGTANILGSTTFSNLNMAGGSLSGAGNLALNGALNYTGGSLNLGGTLKLTSASVLNGPTLTVGNLDLAGGGFTLQSGTLNIGASGALNIGNGTTFAKQGGSLNATTANVSGILDPGGGTLNIGTTNVLATGLLKGVGKLAGKVNNDGTVAPGNSPGILTITGNYVQGPTGVLNIDVGGSTVGTYDQLIIGGNATLNGTLNATLLAYTPASSDVFNIIQSTGATTGTFSTTSLSAPLQIAYLSNGVNLLGPPVVVPVAPGGIVGTTLIPSTELALTGVLEKKDIFPSADENKDVFTAAGGKQPPVCN